MYFNNKLIDKPIHKGNLNDLFNAQNYNNYLICGNCISIKAFNSLNLISKNKAINYLLQERLREQELDEPMIRIVAVMFYQNPDIRTHVKNYVNTNNETLKLNIRRVSEELNRLEANGYPK